MRIFLAPMEGVVDATMRNMLCRFGGIDICVTEFIRVTDHLYPDKVFYRHCPELHDGGLTAAGIPVRVQLLGGQATALALNAAKAARLGASAIDLNFGCPAKTVNRHDGGASLLQHPQRLYTLVKAVRSQVPAHIPVTAKIRLGYNDRCAYRETSRAIYEAGANELTVHARSKADGYRPPAYWEHIAIIRETINIPVIANGEIWTLDDFKRCQHISGCQDFMLGRGLLSQPGLAQQIKTSIQTGTVSKPPCWSNLCRQLLDFFELTVNTYAKKHTGNRLKQWLHYLQRHYPQAKQLFNAIKHSRDSATLRQAIINSSMSSKSLNIPQHREIS
ncbi:MAG: tRNA-dihydrouridine synthase [Cellvibrionaceae bacterium]|nr:tRNA-dihydrouridine synthase [Cellvibrionaceae bacterium]